VSGRWGILHLYPELIGEGINLWGVIAPHRKDRSMQKQRSEDISKIGASSFSGFTTKRAGGCASQGMLKPLEIGGQHDPADSARNSAI
jgi:hypothetical protein